MKSNQYGILVGFLVLFVTSCDNSAPQAIDDALGRAVPKVVSASGLSKHYVEVSFAEAPGSAAQRTDIYRIVKRDGTELAVNAVTPGDAAQQMILTTESQAEGDEYVLSIKEGDLAEGDVQPAPAPTDADGGVTFLGGGGFEPQLLSAISLSNTTVLLTFSLRMDRPTTQNKNFYDVSHPDLNLLGAVLGADDLSLTLTTSTQENIEYTVKVTNVRGNIATYGGFFIDPNLNTATFYGIPPNDTVAPRLTDARATGETSILLSFSEPVNHNAANPTNYAISPSLVITNTEQNVYKTQVLLDTLPMTKGTLYTVTASNMRDLTTPGNLIDPAFNSKSFTFAGAAGLGGDGDADEYLPRVVGAIATSDVYVVVAFSEPMAASTADKLKYEITGPETVFLYVTDAILSPDATSVRLTTSVQADYDYVVHVVGVTDLAGNPLAAPDLVTFPTGFDPTRASFRGIAEIEFDGITDTDGDGFADWFENAGWEILVGLANGGVKRAFVTSDPYVADTDDDGFTDGTENAHNWDPRTNDTDADQLTDGDEFNLWYSDPADQDSDEDGIDDLTEVTFFATSPILPDTDGDGFTDDKELFELSRNPNVADLPRPNIKADNIRLQINEKYSFTDTDGTTNSQTTSTQSTLAQSTETKFSRSDTDVLKVGAEIKLTISKDPSLEIGGSFGAEWTTQTTNESGQMAQQEYQKSVARSREISSTRQVTREIVDASVSATVSIVNEGDIAFTIGNLEVSVLQQGGPNRSKFLPVATLVPAGGNNSFNLGPLIPERGPFIFNNTDVFPNLVEDLLRAPRGLVIKVANFDMTDEFNRNFAFTSQEVNDRTAEIRIDFGDGRRESFHVATYGGLDSNFVFDGSCAHDPAILCTEDGTCDTTGTCARRCSNNSAVTCANDAACGVGGTCETDKTCSNDPESVCSINAECARAGTCNPQSVGGFDDFGGTRGIPLDFALQAILKMIKNPAAPDSIVAGADGFANTVGAGDDVQNVPPATSGLDDREVIVSAGANGILDTAPSGDDQIAKTRGYDTSATCNESTSERIIEPANFGDGVATSVRPLIGSDDVQVIMPGMPVAAGGAIINPGPNGVLETVAVGDDVRLGPGDPCTMNSQCPGGACDAREVITRIENSTNGVRNRFWVALTSDQIPVGTDVGQVNLQPGFVILLAFIQDVDRDGLSAQEEYLNGSNDRDKDTDDDTLGDFAEVRIGWIVDLISGPYQAYSDPRLADSDGDGKTDQDEFMAQTDPRLNDTDLDGIKDNFECDNESGDPMFDLAAQCTPNGTNNVTLPLEATTLDPLNPDSDGDGLDDGSEIALGTCPLDREDGPQFLDSDEDGLTNSEEATPRTISFVNCSGVTIMVPNVTTNPLNGDTDFDGLPDALEVGKASLGLPAISNPDDVDTDNDGLLDYDEFANFAFFQYVGSEYPGFILDGATSQQIGTNLSDCNSDNDALTDAFEHAGSWGVLAFGDDIAREVRSNPLVADSDLDGRIDGEEFKGADGIGYGQPGDTGDATDPQDPDTDGDNRTDGEEVAFGSNPLRADLGVAIRVVDFGALDGHGGGGNNWDFYIQIRRPITGQVNTLLTDQNFSPTGSNACTNYWAAPSDFTSASAPSNLVRFGLNIGDPIVVEGRWLDVSGCSGASIIANCTMLYSETFTSEQMASEGFIPHVFDVSNGECHVVFTLEITVN